MRHCRSWPVIVAPSEWLEALPEMQTRRHRLSGVAGDSRPRAARRRDPAGQADDVFREVEVERLLKESRQTRRNRRFRYEANGQECPDWCKIPQDLDPASAKWQMFLLGPGATIHA